MILMLYTKYKVNQATILVYSLYSTSLEVCAVLIPTGKRLKKAFF